jgi:hypothetical protein
VRSARTLGADEASRGGNGNDFEAVDAVAVDQSLGYIHHRCIKSGREQLNAVAPRVLRVEPPYTGQCLIPDHLLADIPQTLGKRVDLVGGYAHSWVHLARWCEAILDANVQLLFSAAKPDSAASTKRLGLLDLHQPEKTPVEPPRLSLATSRRRHLHMIEANYAHPPKLSHRARARFPNERLTRQKFDH